MKNEFTYTEEVTGEIVNIPINLLHHHHDNPRKDLGDLSELTESIKAKGVLQNLTVVPYWFKVTGVGCDDPKQQAEMGYLVVIGNRRLEAAKAAGLETLPCIIADMTPAEQVQTMLLENMQRSDLTVYEQAQGFQMMMDFGDSVETIAEKTGFSKATIRRRLKWAELDGATMQTVSARQIDLGDLDKLSQIDNIDTRNLLLAEVGTNNFDREFQKALGAQKRAKIKAGWEKILKKYEVAELEYSEIWDGKYENLGYGEGEPDEGKIADLKTQYGTLYFAWGYNDVLYLRADRPLNKEKSSEQIRREREIEEFRTRREKMDELKKSAFELRYNFIKNYSVQDCKKNIEKVTDWLYFRQAIELMGEAMFDGFYNSSNCAKTFRTLFDCINGEDRPKLKEYIEKRPEKAFLYTIYAMWCDGEGNDCSDYSLHYRGNPRLVGLYRGLCSLGYKMSDDEIKMLNGTHELYVKGDDDTVDTEDDEVIEEEEISDDDFDADLKEKLNKILDEVEKG